MIKHSRKRSTLVLGASLGVLCAVTYGLHNKNGQASQVLLDDSALEGVGDIYDVQFSPDGRLLAAVDEPDPQQDDGELHLWSLPSGQEHPIQRAVITNNVPADIAFTPGSHRIVGICNWGLGVWNVSGGTSDPVITTPPVPVESSVGYPPQNVGPLFVSSNGTAKCVEKADYAEGQHVCVTDWDLATAKPLGTKSFPQPPNIQVNAFAISQDGRYEALSQGQSLPQGNFPAPSAFEGIAVYAVASGRKVTTLLPPSQTVYGNGSVADNATSLTFSCDDRMLAWMDVQHRCLICDIHSGQIVGMLSGLGVLDPSGEIVESFGPDDGTQAVLAFSPNDRYLAAGCSDGRLRVYDLRTCLPIRTLQKTGSAIRLIRFSPNGRFLATVSKDSVLTLWRV